MAAGRLVVLEGIDGSGTTTQCALLAEALRQRGYTVHTTGEPSKGPIGLLLREELRARADTEAFSAVGMALLYAADRMHHCQRELMPALQTHDVVISDRYVLSTFVYQGLQVDLPWLKSLNQFALVPAVTLLLDLPVEEAQARVVSRGGEREIFDDLQIQQSLRKRYLQLAHGMPHTHVVDGSGDKQMVLARLLERLCA